MGIWCTRRIVFALEGKITDINILGTIGYLREKISTPDATIIQIDSNTKVSKQTAAAIVEGKIKEDIVALNNFEQEQERLS